MEWNDVNDFMDLERALHKKCNQSPMVVAKIAKLMSHSICFNLPCSVVHVKLEH